MDDDCDTYDDVCSRRWHGVGVRRVGEMMGREGDRWRRRITTYFMQVFRRASVKGQANDITSFY
jgi:hypothetical protein